LTGEWDPSEPDDSNIGMVARGLVGEGEDNVGERGGEEGDGVRGRGGEAGALVNDVCEGVGEPIRDRLRTLQQTGLNPILTRMISGSSII
jgi:hypothetical protein